MANTITKAFDKTWIIDEGGVRFFLLEGNEKAMLIDCGMMTKDAKDIAESLTDKPIDLYLTHADRDHIASIEQFDYCYMNPAECSNFYKGNGAKADFRPVWDGDIIDLGGREIEAITIPGHTPGSTAYLDKASKVLISGDPIQNGNIFMFGIQREMHAYIKSIDKLCAMADKFDEIWPSHANLPESKEILPKLKEGALKVLAGEIEGEKVNMFGNEITRYDIGCAGFLYD